MLAKPLVSFAAVAMLVLASPAQAAETASPAAHGARHHARTHHERHAAPAKSKPAEKPRAGHPSATPERAKPEAKVAARPEPKAAPVVEPKACTPAPVVLPMPGETTLDELRAALGSKRSDRHALPQLPASLAVPLEVTPDDDARDGVPAEPKSDPRSDAQADARAEAKTEPHAPRKETARPPSTVPGTVKGRPEHGTPRATPKAIPAEPEPGQKRRREMKSPGRRHHAPVKRGPIAGATGSSV